MGEYYITVTTTLSTGVEIPRRPLENRTGSAVRLPVASRLVDILFAIDAGTTGVRTLAVDLDGRVLDVSYRPLTQHFPSPGFVEHDGTEIVRLVIETLSADVSERGATRMDDQTSEASMEKRKKDGYF